MNDIIKRNKFPIDTTDVLANSGKEGLCPIFDTDIVARRNETNNPISEKGIRNELDKFDPSVTYESVGESTSATFNILHSIEPNKATYNNLLFENGGSGYLNDNVLYLSGSPQLVIKHLQKLYQHIYLVNVLVVVNINIVKLLNWII